jgi:tetratricopeptide (TPR) repeat protein
MKKYADSNLKLFRIAVEELNQGMVCEAKEKFRRLTFLTPWNKYGYFHLGRCLLREEEYADATEEFGKAISISPDFVEAYLGLSLAHNLLGEFDKAIIVLEHAIKLKPQDPNLYYHLGITCEYGVQEGSGVLYFKKALELSQENVYANFELGNYYLRVKKYSKAIKYFQDCLDTDAHFAPALIRLVQIYEKKKCGKKLCTIYSALIRAEPHNINHYIGMVGILLQRNDLKGASEIIQKAMNVEPKNAKLQAMNIYTNKRLKGNEDGLVDEIEAIEEVIQEHRNINQRRMESLHSEIKRLKREKDKLRQRLVAQNVQLKEIGKKVTRLKRKFKKKAEEIEGVRGKNKKDEMTEELANEVIEIAHNTIEEQMKGTKKEIEEVKKEIKEIFGKEYWCMLTKEARHFLATAEYLYSFARGEDIDFGLISVELSKAIEVELNDKLIKGFIAYLKGNEKQTAFIRSNLRRTTNGRPLYHTKLAYIVDSKNYPEMKTLSLGQINLLLHDSIDGRTGTTVFKDFIQRKCKDPSYFLDVKRFPKILESIIIRYRNPFAHSEYLKILDFEKFRSEIFYGFEGGIFVQLLDACRVENA